MGNSLDSLKFCDEAASLIDLWLALPREAGVLCPAKSDFSPMKMRKHLGSVVLYERLATGEVIARVAGTHVERFLGVSITGQNVLNILPPEYRRAYHQYYLNLAEFPCVGGVERQMRSAGGVPVMVKSLMLPLQNNAGQITHFVGVAQSFPPPKHFTDYRGVAMAASRNLDVNYFDIGAGVPDHGETTMARGI